jgi:hypothetical protein
MLSGDFHAPSRHLRSTTTILVAAGLAWMACPQAKADEPKPKPENTISIQLGEPVPPQKFEHPPKFWIADVTDRSGNPQPMMVMKERGGVFLDKHIATATAPRASCGRITNRA